MLLLEHPHMAWITATPTNEENDSYARHCLWQQLKPSLSDLWVMLLVSYVRLSIVTGPTAVAYSLHYFACVSAVCVFDKANCVRAVWGRSRLPQSLPGKTDVLALSPVHSHAHTRTHKHNITYCTYESDEVTPKSGFMWKALIHFPPLKSQFHFIAWPNIEHDSSLNIWPKSHQL